MTPQLLLLKAVNEVLGQEGSLSVDTVFSLIEEGISPNDIFVAANKVADALQEYAPVPLTQLTLIFTETNLNG